MSCGNTGLGDRLESALTTVGITSERVERWLRKPCYCEERKQRLNQLGAWANRVLSGNLHKAVVYLEEFIGKE